MPLSSSSVDAWVDLVRFTINAAELCPEVLDDGAGGERDLTEIREEAAEFMFWMTGFAFPGATERVLTTCLDSCGGCGGAHWSWMPTPVMNADKTWTNSCCGGCGDSCCDTNGLSLLPTPVQYVTAVSMDGVQVAAGDFELRDGKVVLLNGASWVGCKTIEVDYVAGRNPPSWVARAAREYARELACLDYCPSKCRLPEGWGEIRTQYITVKKAEKQKMNPLLGITPNIDRVISFFLGKDGKPMRAGRVFSPDIAPNYGRVVGGSGGLGTIGNEASTAEASVTTDIVANIALTLTFPTISVITSVEFQEADGNTLTIPHTISGNVVTITSLASYSPVVVTAKGTT